MSQSFYQERDYAFGQAMLTLRTHIGMTQTGLAERLGITRKAMNRWEAGDAYPKVSHLKALLAFALEQRAFPSGREEEEIRTFWHIAHQKVLLDEGWLQEVLGQQPIEEMSNTQQPRVDWSDALAVPSFYGRVEERAMLTQWVVEEHCQVVSVLGLGGIGKSALVVSVMHQVAEHFQVVIWRSLRDLPSCEALLDECLQILAPKVLQDVSVSLEKRLGGLLECLRNTRVLLVLDNLEALIEEGQSTGSMRPGYEAYSQVLRRIAETEHQSCLLLTSREKLVDLVPLEGNKAPIRALRLARLTVDACVHLLAEKDIVGSAAERTHLIEAYAGNPLALKIVSQTIVELFAGSIAPFLEQGEVIFGGVRELLRTQYARLADLEQTVMCWLAIVREPVTMSELRTMLVVPRPSGELLEALDGLLRRSLIERGRHPGSFTLQSVVLEYVTMQLVAEASDELGQERLVRLLQHGLSQASSKYYVRQTQERLLLTPLLARLQSMPLSHATVEEHLCSLLDHLRTWTENAQGYGPANLITLLRVLRGNLCGLNLSQLSIRGAYLQSIEMQDTTLAGALLRETAFTEVFDAPWVVTISSNGLYWAGGCRRGGVRVWREGGKILHLGWQAHTDMVQVLAVSPDGAALATGSWDGTLKLWDLKNGNLLWMVQHTSNIQSIAFAPDGATLASGGDDAAIRLWDVHKGHSLQNLSGQNSPVYALAWSLDGSLLVSGSFDGEIRLWEMQGAQPGSSRRIFTGHTAPVRSLAFAPDGRTLASGSFDQTVKLWDMDSGDVRQTLVGHMDLVNAVAWSMDGRILASCSRDQTIWLWDVKRGSYSMILYGHTAAVNAITFTSDGRSLLSVSEDNTLRMWDVESGQCIRIKQGYSVTLYDVAWSPDSTHLASAGSDRLVSIWESTGRTAPKLLRGHKSRAFGVGWSPDGSWLASSGWDNVIQIWNATTGASVRVMRDLDDPYTCFYGVAWSPDGQQLACGNNRQEVQMWEVSTGTRQWVAGEQTASARRVARSPDGMLLASSGDDGIVYLWNASDGLLLKQLRGHQGKVNDVAWSCDGKWLASGGGNQGQEELFVWDIHSEERVRVLSGHPGIGYAVAWSQNGAMLISGGSDGMLRWWHRQSGECIRVCQAHQGPIQRLQVSPDGNWLASCSDDGAIHIWDFEGGDLVHTLRRDRPYERLNISGIRGATEAQKMTLCALGAFEKTGIGQ